MSKRFIDSTIWTQNKWFRKLPVEYKALWFYLLSTCDNVGVWEEDIELAGYIIGHEFPLDYVMKYFESQIQVFNSKKWWIKDFCDFQYGELKEEAVNNRPHQSYIALLKKHGLWQNNGKYTLSNRDKDKDKDKDTLPEEKIPKEDTYVFGESDFEELWEKYPRKLGKTKALAKFLKTVKTNDDWLDIQWAVGNYVRYVEGKDEQFIKHGSTWFNEWRDWIDVEVEDFGDTNNSR